MGRELVNLKGRTEIAEQTMAFRFDKPVGFQFTAGQYVDVTLVDPAENDSQGDTRAFFPWPARLLRMKF